MRLPRMTTRRWMEVVLLVGVAIGTTIVGQRLKQRDRYCRDRAQHHEWLADVCRATARFDHSPNLPRLVEYHVEMARKYRHAAGAFWLPVPTEPPPR